MDKPTVVVNAVIFDKERKVLITKRCDDGTLCLPGGFVEWGETVLDAVKREVWEEIRVSIDVSSLIGLYSENNIEVKPPALVNSIILLFLCNIVSGEPELTEEVQEILYLSNYELDQVLPRHRERIRHALSFDGNILIS